MKTLDRATVTAASVLSVLLIFGFGTWLLVREQNASRMAVRETFETAATDLADNLAIHVKIQDVASINRVLSHSYVRKASSFVTVSDQAGRPLFFLPEGDRPRPAASCKGELGREQITYAGAVAGHFEFCYQIPSAISRSGLVAVLGTYVLGSMLLALLLIGFIRFNNRQIAEFLDWLDAIEITNARRPRVPHRNVRDASIRRLYSKVSHIVEELGRVTTVALESHRAETLANLSAQVAHDIRSPLAVLESASADLSSLSEEQRLLIRGAAAQVRDIANGLLSRYVAAPAAPTAGRVMTPTLLSGLLEGATSEARVQYRCHRELVINDSLEPAARVLFAKVDSTEFKRLLSNLINNAVEALPENRGQVEVALRSDAGHAVITVRDNGKGIEPEVLAVLGSRGTTHGKVGGSGLGLAHAKACAAGWGGQLQLDSVVGNGTTVTLTLPGAHPPAWFVSEISAQAGGTVVVLDDDTSIHQLWRRRLEAATGAGALLELVHAFNPADLRNWLAANPDKARRAQYLLDQHLVGSSETGLDLAEGLGITAQSILVTSAYDDPRVIDRCEKLGVRLLPKSLARFVHVRVDAPGAVTPELVDAVLIDDDALVRTLWAGDARSHGKTLKAFSRPADFLAVAHTIDKRSPIYIDHILGEKERGALIARDVRRLGFTTIYLATGQSPEAFGDMPWITKIVGKSSPWQSGALAESEVLTAA